MTTTTQYIVALEIGSSKIVGALAEKTTQGLELKYLKEEKIQNCVRYGNIVNLESTRNSIANILQAIETNISGKITKIYVGVSGRGMHSVPCNITQNFDPQQIITESVLSDLNKQAWHTRVDGYETISLVNYGYKVNNTVQTKPVGCDCTHIDATINRIVVKPSTSLNLKRVFEKDNNPEPICTALAVGPVVAKDDERALGCMVVDLGAETTTISIYRNGELFYLTTLPMGGRNITRDITHLGILEDSAERVKINLQNPFDTSTDNKVLIENVWSCEAANHIVARTGEIIANINQQITDAQLAPNNIHSIILLGGASQLRGFDRKLEESTKIKVRTASLPSRIKVTSSAFAKTEYIEILALLVRASELIPADKSCVKINEYQGGGRLFDDTKDEPPVEQEPPKKRGGLRAFIEKIKNRTTDLIDTADVDDDHFDGSDGK